MIDCIISKIGGSCIITKSGLIGVEWFTNTPLVANHIDKSIQQRIKAEVFDRLGFVDQIDVTVISLEVY